MNIRQLNLISLHHIPITLKRPFPWKKNKNLPGWIIEWLRLEGTFAQAGISRGGCQGPHLGSFWKSSVRRFHKLTEQSELLLCHLCSTKVLPDVQTELTMLSSQFPILELGTTEKSLAPNLFALSFQKLPNFLLSLKYKAQVLLLVWELCSARTGFRKIFMRKYNPDITHLSSNGLPISFLVSVLQDIHRILFCKP